MTPLLPHQHVGAAFLAERRTALLADGMRVGKTPAAIGGADLIGARLEAAAPLSARETEVYLDLERRLMELEAAAIRKG